jgi:Xaa-Pro aminopeptidase
VLVDFGVKKGGYCCDFTRCYFRKNGMAEEKAYEKCKAVYKEIIASLPGCRTGRDVALLSEKLIEKHGLPPLIHSIGHGIGLEVHEAPRLWKKSGDSLEGAALAIEPGAYFARFGVRYEGMVAHVNGKWREI